VIIHPGPQETDAVDGLYSSYMDSITKFLAGYSDDELILMTEFIYGLIKLKHEQADNSKRP
jgi:hypothetical protein